MWEQKFNDRQYGGSPRAKHHREKQLLPEDLGSKQEEGTGFTHTVDYSLFRTRIREKSQEPGGSIVLGIILGFLLPPKQKTRKLIQITT